MGNQHFIANDFMMREFNNPTTRCVLGGLSDSRVRVPNERTADSVKENAAQ
jgi:hypothetical protein